MEYLPWLLLNLIFDHGSFIFCIEVQKVVQKVQINLSLTESWINLNFVMISHKRVVNPKSEGSLKVSFREWVIVWRKQLYFVDFTQN